MEVEVGIAHFGVHKDCVSGFWVCTSGKNNQSGPNELIAFNFDQNSQQIFVFGNQINNTTVNNFNIS